MNKNRYFTVIMCMLLVSSSVVFAGPWDWFKGKIGDIVFAYKRWNIPRPRLIEHDITELVGSKRFEEFRYDLSRDSNIVKDLRKKLHISGIYLSNDSDMDTYKKYLQIIPVPEQYIENGFDVNLNNSISGCMFRLFTEVVEKGGLVMFTGTPEEDAWMQLLWELEASLPKDFDTDETGDKFITFIKSMFPREISEKQKRMLGYYIPFWSYYTLRFTWSKGLPAAYRRMMEQSNKISQTK